MTTYIRSNNIDLNGQQLILDADGNTHITSDTDDQIDIAIAGADDFQFTANTFTVLTGSNIDLNATTLQGGSGSAGDLTLTSTTNATKGCVTIADGEQGIKIGGQPDRATTEGTNQLVLIDGTAPVGTLTNAATLYSVAGELTGMDSAGNSTTLTPHTSDGDYIIKSYSAAKGETLTVHLEKLLKALAAKDKEIASFIEVEKGGGTSTSTSRPRGRR